MCRGFLFALNNVRIKKTIKTNKKIKENKSFQTYFCIFC